MAKKNVISKKLTCYGKEKEDSLIDSGIVGVITDNNDQFYKICLGEHPIKWGIGGKIDGFRDGVLVEIKNRKSKLYIPLPIYDIVQVQSYMQILNVQNAILIQCLITQYGTHELKETNLKRDDLFWNKEVLPELILFIEALYEFSKDTLVTRQIFSNSRFEENVCHKFIIYQS